MLGSGFFHSVLLLWDSSMILSVLIVHYFYCWIVLYWFATVCLPIHLLMDICLFLFAIITKFPGTGTSLCTVHVLVWTYYLILLEGLDHTVDIYWVLRELPWWLRHYQIVVVLIFRFTQAWDIPWTEESDGPQSVGTPKKRTRLSD